MGLLKRNRPEINENFAGSRHFTPGQGVRQDASMTLSLNLGVRLAHLECITPRTKAQLRRGQGVHWGQTFPKARKRTENIKPAVNKRQELARYPA